MPLTTVTRRPIIDVAGVLDTPLKLVTMKSFKRNNRKIMPKETKIYSGGNFSGRHFSGGQFSWGDIFPGFNFPGAIFSGAFFRGAFFPVDIIPDTGTNKSTKIMQIT